MNAFVESLKRLYGMHRVTLEKLASLLQAGKITQAQYDYIIGA